MATIIYLAARYERAGELNGYKAELQAAGYEVNSRWLLNNQQIHKGVDKVESTTLSIPGEGLASAMDDMQDVRAADVLISFTRSPRVEPSRGGPAHRVWSRTSLGQAVDCGRTTGERVPYTSRGRVFLEMGS